MPVSLRLVAPLLLIASTLGAQANQPAQIPTVLASTVLGGFGEMFGSKPQFSVGEAPATWPKKLVPPAPASVIGGLTMGFMSTTVVSYPKSVDGIAQLEKFLISAGFTRPPVAPTRSGFGQVGLGPMTDANAFCSDSLHVTIAVADSTSEPRTYVLSGVRPVRGMEDPCTPGESRMMGRRELPLKIPALRPPPGVRAQLGGTSSSGNSMQATVRLDTTFGASYLLNHYSRQLAAAGWQLSKPPAGDDDVAIQRLVAKDDKGDTWRGALIVMSTLSNREVILNMRADSEP